MTLIFKTENTIMQAEIINPKLEAAIRKQEAEAKKREEAALKQLGR